MAKRYPETRTVVEHRSHTEISLLRASDLLMTPMLLDFEVSVAALFE